MAMSLEILAADGLATVQDLSRPGLGHLGIAESGACDRASHRKAQLLCFNDVQTAGLELQQCDLRARLIGGPRLCSVVGDCRWTVDGRVWPPGRSVWVEAGQEIRAEPASGGCRTYLALSGGIDVPRLGGSASTHVFARLGGWHGRGLRAGDALKLGFTAGDCRELMLSQPSRSPDGQLCAVWTAAARLISAAARTQLASELWHVGAQSDRTAVALVGARLALRASLSELSQPTACGAIQVAGDGTPRILLRDRPTIGGFPQVAVIATTSLDDAGQLRPGDAVRLQFVSPAQARRALRERHQLQTALETCLVPAWPPSSRQLFQLL